MNEQENLPKGKGASAEANEHRGQAKRRGFHYRGCKRLEAVNESPPREVNCTCEAIRKNAERDLSARSAAATLLGKTKSAKKAAASRANGRKGGRPSKLEIRRRKAIFGY